MIFSPKFNYKGFQYVGISSSEPIELTADNIRALELHSDVPEKDLSLPPIQP